MPAQIRNPTPVHTNQQDCAGPVTNMALMALVRTKRKLWRLVAALIFVILIGIGRLCVSYYKLQYGPPPGLPDPPGQLIRSLTYSQRTTLKRWQRLTFYQLDPDQQQLLDQSMKLLYARSSFLRPPSYAVQQCELWYIPSSSDQWQPVGWLPSMTVPGREPRVWFAGSTLIPGLKNGLTPVGSMQLRRHWWELGRFLP